MYAATWKLAIDSAHIKAWVPEQQRVDGHELPFVKLSPYERNFYRFCTGEAIKWGAHTEWTYKPFPFWAAAKARRYEASVEAFRKAIVNDGDDDATIRKKQKKLPKYEDSALCPVVAVELEFNGSVVTSQMLFGLRGDMWIKAESATMLLIQEAMKHDFETQGERPHKSRKAAKSSDDAVATAAKSIDSVATASVDADV